MINSRSISQLRVLASVPDPFGITLRDRNPFTEIRGLKITPNFWKESEPGLNAAIYPSSDFTYIPAGLGRDHAISTVIAISDTNYSVELLYN